jgi:hypothetical protein
VTSACASRPSLYMYPDTQVDCLFRARYEDLKPSSLCAGIQWESHQKRPRSHKKRLGTLG